MAPRFLFRCDSNARVGFGHFSRCLNLARVLRAQPEAPKVTFWGEFDDFASSSLLRHDVARLDLPVPGHDAEAAGHLADVARGFDALVLDSYELVQSHVDALASRNFKLCVFSDTHELDLRDVDLAICFRAGAESVPFGARTEALGLGYLVVKPELRALRLANSSVPSQPIRRILVCLGGTEVSPSSFAALLRAVSLPGMSVSYIMNGESPHAVETAKPIRPRPDMEQLYAATDMVISGGGLIKYESAFCLLPNASLSVTAVQQRDTQIMASRNLTLDLGTFEQFDPVRVSSALRGLISNPAALACQREAGMQALDSESTQRLAAVLLSL